MPPQYWVTNGAPHPQFQNCSAVPATRLWRIVLLKMAYYVTSSARNFAKLCQNYARIPKLCSWFSKLCSQNDVDSVHIGAQKRHQSTDNVFQICCCWKFICVLWQFVSALSCPNRARRICQKRPSIKACQNEVNTTISEAKTRIVKTYYLNIIYFCRKYTTLTKFYEFILQKELKFANYAVVVLV